MMHLVKTVFLVGLITALMAGLMYLLSRVPTVNHRKEEPVVHAAPAVPVAPPVPLVFKCGNPKDLVIGTRVRDNCENCKMPKGALGTITSGLMKCGTDLGFTILYDNYRAPDEENGEFCTTPATLEIISQPRCEP